MAKCVKCGLVTTSLQSDDLCTQCLKWTTRHERGAGLKPEDYYQAQRYMDSLYRSLTPKETK